jgi:BirA family biotin operon repressor/biotin-[acetyl-CoA-carboxylase] ligase
MLMLDPKVTSAGVRLISHDEIESTNAEALRVARLGERGPLWITATRQIRGRGRRGRAWVSEGGNLYASLLLNDPAPARNWPELSFVAALAVHDAVSVLAPALGPRLAIKWPNDLLLAGAKFAGILIEGEGGDGGWVVVGIGVNCVSHPAVTDYPACDLAAAGVQVGPQPLFAALSSKMLERLAQWRGGHGFSSIRSDWQARAAGLGEEIRLGVADGVVCGRFEGLDAAGHLVLALAGGGREVIAAGDVIALSGRGAGQLFARSGEPR